MKNLKNNFFKIFIYLIVKFKIKPLYIEIIPNGYGAIQ